jgi:hypothetical protein
VVGGLIQQQKIRPREQRRRKRQPHAPPAAEAGRRRRLPGRVKPQTRQDLRCARACRVGVRLGLPLVEIVQQIVCCLLSFL